MHRFEIELSSKTGEQASLSDGFLRGFGITSSVGMADLASLPERFDLLPKVNEYFPDCDDGPPTKLSEAAALLHRTSQFCLLCALSFR